LPLSVEVAAARLPDVVDERVPNCLSIALVREVDITTSAIADLSQNASIHPVSRRKLLKSFADEPVECSIDLADGLAVCSGIGFLETVELILYCALFVMNQLFIQIRPAV
jgi:hypothetical protein